MTEGVHLSSLRCLLVCAGQLGALGNDDDGEELAAVVTQLPVLDLTDLPAARAALAEMYAQIKPSGANPGDRKTHV